MEQLITNNIITEYQGSRITFERVNGTIMVNATEMAKPFGKKAIEWLSNKQPQELIVEISTEVGIPTSQLVVAEHGVGTWMHEDVALAFAQWLSPKFYVWCNKKIKELLTTGHVEITSTGDSFNRKLTFANWASGFLRLNDVSKLIMAKQIAQEVGLENSLPSYVKSNGVTKSVTELLREHSINMSTIAFNKLLYNKGYLEKMERQKSSGGTEFFYNVTEKGLEYGENFKSEKSPGKTQPYWYVEKFKELLNKVGLTSSC